MSNTNGFVNLPVGIYLNVRQEPNLYSTVLTSLAPKTELTILEQNGEWYKINYNNSIAYVFASAVKATNTIKEGGMSLELDIPNNSEFGDAGEQPTFNWNALVTTNIIPIKNSAGVLQKGYSTSNGDHITIIKTNSELGLTFIQYPDQGSNMYQQGWIDSSYISSEYLDFRFSQTWINQIDSQKIYLFDNTISSTTLDKNAKYTLLYTVSNYNIEYSCILFEENGQQQLGFTPAKTGALNFIVPKYPYNISNECSVGYLEPTIPPNATVNTTIKLMDVNGIEPNYTLTKDGKASYPTLSAGDRISIIQIFTSAEEQSILIEYYDSGSNTYKKAYLPTKSIEKDNTGKYKVSIDENTITWNDKNGVYDLMNLTDSSIMYKLPASQSVQYLYTVGDFACILFNNNNLSGWPIQTAYTKLSNGSFIQKSPKILHGFVHKNGKTYYFNESGVMQTGWQTINGAVYYFNTQGIMQLGWEIIDNKMYCFNYLGIMQTGWYKQWNHSYYFNSDGTQAIGWKTIDKHKYYFNNQGIMQLGWKTIDNHKYYFNNQGIMQLGWEIIDNKMYCFNYLGIMQTGWYKQWNHSYYFNSDGTQAIGWKTIDNHMYYFNNQGIMQTGWFKEWNNSYYFNADGTQATGWNKIDNSWYYFNIHGVMQTGWQKVKNVWYYLNSSGIMQIGWQEIDNTWYYFNNSGAMETGWIEWKNSWYYLESSGAMATNTTIDGWNINSSGVSNRN